MADQDVSDLRALLEEYSSCLLCDGIKYASGRVPLVLPCPEVPLVSKLFEMAQSIFQAEPVLLNLHAPCVIVGDIHGQILDLFRILHAFGMPPHQHYLFLGDLVDRGEFSVECLVVVLLLKCLYPDQVHLIRGNHEFGTLCSQCGFMMQFLNFFTSTLLYEQSLNVFRYIPLGARIDGTILCVHGGIGPAVTDIDCILSLRRPIDGFGNDILDSLVWSDPCSTITEFEENTTRGTGYNFGGDALARFLQQSGLRMLVRAHECVEDGVSFSFGESLVTVFSASNYCGLIGNMAGVLEVNGPGNCVPRKFQPLPWLTRASVTFGKAPEPLAGLIQGSPRKKARGVEHSASFGILPMPRQLHDHRQPNSPLIAAPPHSPSTRVTKPLAKRTEIAKRKTPVLD
jgi:protein phosphatase